MEFRCLPGENMLMCVLGYCYPHFKNITVRLSHMHDPYCIISQVTAATVFP